MYHVILRVEDREVVNFINLEKSERGFVSIKAAEDIKIGAKKVKSIETGIKFFGHFGKYESIGFVFTPKVLNELNVELRKNSKFLYGCDDIVVRLENTEETPVVIKKGEILVHVKSFTKNYWDLYNDKTVSSDGIQSIPVEIFVIDKNNYQYIDGTWVSPDDESRENLLSCTTI